MEIIKTDIANLRDDKKTFYRMTKGETLNVKNMTDEDLDREYPVNGYLLYKDTNNRGEDVEILAILSDGGTVVTTVSATFKKSFFEMVELFEDDPFSIRVISGVSRNGRSFFDCTLGD